MEETDGISLPRSHRPLFPNACAACGEPSPNDTLVFYGALNVSMRLWPPRRRFSVEVPLCAGCRGGLVGKRRLARLFSTLFWGTYVAFAIWGAITFPRRVDRRLLLFLGVAIGIGPYLLIDFFLAMPVTLEVEGDSISYSFANPEFAAEFTRLNVAPTDPALYFRESQ